MKVCFINGYRFVLGLFDTRCRARDGKDRRSFPALSEFVSFLVDAGESSGRNPGESAILQNYIGARPRFRPNNDFSREAARRFLGSRVHATQ